jgi:imidazolonepropionase-like amidohydrolase
MEERVKRLRPTGARVGIVLATILSLNAAPSLASESTLITNVNIFDGKSEKLINDQSVLIENNLIKQIGKGIEAPQGALVVDGDRRTLMPGLLDSHTHLMINDAPHVSIYEKPWAFVGAQAVAAETSSFKLSPYFTGIPDKAELFGWGYVADGVPEVQKAAREVLRTGAAQIKVMAGGGVSSYFDPLDTMQYTLDELRAIVIEAEHWGTYVAAHAYTDDAVRMCIEAGIKSIEHGPFLTEKTLKLMAKEGVWLSPQAYLFGMTPENLNIIGTPAEPKMRRVNDESDQVLKTAKGLGVKIAWGTDLFGPLPKQALQPLEFTARQKYFSNVEILRQVTSGNAELFSLSGKRHPYQEGDLGVIKVGAYADLLLVEGNPLEDLELMIDPGKNFRLIIKDGVIYKNTL